MSSQPGNAFEAMGREDLLRALEMFAKNWLAHDGCWFLAAEERFDMETAIELDARSWKRFASAEARRIMTTFNIPAGGGLEALERALSLRLYAVINSQRTEWSDDRKRLCFFMDVCRVQEARRRKGLPDFPCKSVGISRVRNLRFNDRSANSYDLPALSSRRSSRPVLWVGVHDCVTGSHPVTPLTLGILTLIAA